MRASATATTSPSEFLTAADVMARYHVGRMWIERRIKDSNFPRPFKFGHTVNAVRRWRRPDIEAWEAVAIDKHREAAQQPCPK